MCDNCDYSQILRDAKIRPTKARRAVLQALGEVASPMSAEEIHARTEKLRHIHRVTLYRTLELLVEKGVVRKLSAGDRAFRFALAWGAHRHEHAHFYCRKCDSLRCIDPGVIPLDSIPLPRGAGLLEKVELRLDGLCHRCMKGDDR
jgi:Fur family ferric uptake transcriptional regulator